MSRIQKEMKILSRNNVERQKLCTKITDLNYKQIKRHEQCSHEIRLMSGEMRKFRQTSGRSSYGMISTDREASQLIHHSDLLKTKWQLTGQPPDESNIPRTGLSSAAARISSSLQPHPPSVDQTKTATSRLRHSIPQSGKHSSLTDNSINLPNVLDSRSSLLGSRSHTVIGTEGQRINQKGHRGRVLRIPPVHHQQLPPEQERSAVRRTTIILSPDTNPKPNTPTCYVKPQLRYKYDLLTSKRLMFLRRLLPADFVDGNEHQLSSAFSINSRRSALGVLQDLNNQKIKKSLERKPDTALQDKVMQFFDSLQ